RIKGSFDERYKLVPRKMSSLKAKQPKKPPPKRTRNVGKSKRTHLSTSSSTESPPSDNGYLTSTKLSPRSYSSELEDDPNMSKEQRETRGMFMIHVVEELHENCGIHTLFMNGTPMQINMLVEKKYPLIKDLLEKMLNLQLEAEEESTMAFELLKFIKSQIKEQ
ncbi:hypothetical protein Tco_1491814, partial [Tanacetum coccineum]